MSDIIKIEYEIVLKDSLLVIRGCPKCGKKTHFCNTKKFRVNANGNKLDVWLIYQCQGDKFSSPGAGKSSCRHTLNLAIYERKNVSSIPKEEYMRFLENDELLAEQYGKNMQLFQKNKADVDFEHINYEYVKLQEISENSGHGERIVLTIHNPYQLKIHPQKQMAEALGMSRSQIKKLVEQGKIKLEKNPPFF